MALSLGSLLAVLDQPPLATDLSHTKLANRK